ncbi:MAG: hypothetical protein Ct9H90mP22_8490 [Gammaproteobacteria bacterium]|nr:MAG: hypothetical protein Ct9H90mP22_8490 [Gammaproteobacteria bacterium]
MKRIVTPLEKMGCKISSNNGFLPLSIDASDGITAIDYDMTVARHKSNQVYFFQL